MIDGRALVLGHVGDTSYGSRQIRRLVLYILEDTAPGVKKDIRCANRLQVLSGTDEGNLVLPTPENSTGSWIELVHKCRRHSAFNFDVERLICEALHTYPKAVHHFGMVIRIRHSRN